MLISCSSLALVWSELQSFHPLNVDSVKDLLEKLFRQDSLYNVVIIVLWNIWKHKNSKVSQDVFEELHITASKIADDWYLGPTGIHMELINGTLRIGVLYCITYLGDFNFFLLLFLLIPVYSLDFV